MMPIFSRRCCRETRDKFRLDRAHYLLKGKCRKVMAFIDDYLPVLGNKILYDILLAKRQPDSQSLTPKISARSEITRFSTGTGATSKM